MCTLEYKDGSTRGFFDERNGSVPNQKFYIERFGCLNGSLHGEIVAGECVVYVFFEKGFHLKNPFTMQRTL